MMLHHASLILMLKTQVIQRHTGWCHPSFKLLYNQLASLDMIYSAVEAKLASLDVIYSPEVLGIGVICTNLAHQLDRHPVVRSPGPMQFPQWMIAGRIPIVR